MYAADRNLSPEDLSRALDRYKKLSRETAQNIVNFHERYVKPRVQAELEADTAGAAQANVEEDEAPLVPEAESRRMANVSA